MEYDEFDFRSALKRVIYVLVVWMVVLFVLVLLSSCKQVEYVTVDKVLTDTTYITKWQRDSIWLHDSIHVKEKGDTVLVEKWHTQWRDRLRVDTIYQATHDTIPQPYPIETVKLVEKDLNWWQRLRLWIGNIGLLGILGVIGFYGVKLWRVYKIF